ncbi:MAG TPA: DUF4199 domain-containing protein [Bacteroidales bacterium]|nr:DUF4199 domain-containing protein [Bacteroidales bacterium]
METKVQSPAGNALLYGAITGVIMILFTLIMYLANLYMVQWLQWVSLIFVIGGMVLGTLNYRTKITGGYITFGKAFLSNFLIGLFASILASIFFYFYVKYINTGLIEESMEAARQKMASSGGLSEEQIDKAIEIQSKFMTPAVMTFFGILFNAVLSVVLALILGLILKKEDKNLQPFS